MVQIRGRYFPAGSSDGIEASLHCTGEQALLVAGDTRIEVNWNELSISDRLASLPRQVTFQDQSHFITQDNQSIDDWLAQGGRKPGFSVVSWFESSWRWAILAALAVPATLYLLFTVGMPLIATPLATAIPDSITQRLDREILELLDDRLMAPSELPEPRSDALKKLYGELWWTEGSDLQFRKGRALGANALALPGGTVVITDELAALIEHDGEFVAVLAHEMGHVALNHSMRNLVQVAGVGLVLGWILGDLSAVTDIVLVGAPTLLQQLSYSRRFENEADQYSLLFLEHSGYSASCFASLLEKLGDAHDIGESSYPDFLSSHPNIGARIALGQDSEPCGAGLSADGLLMTDP
jgi:Zn-dependent protease with chaperone function